MKRRIFIFVGKIAFLVSGLFLCVFLFNFSEIFRIKKVYVNCSKTIPLGFDIFQNKYLGLVDENEIKQSILSKNIFLKDIQLKQKFPDSIELTCIVRVPKALLNNNDSQRYVDEDGVFFSSDDVNDLLPTIFIVSTKSIQISQKDWRLIKIISYIDQLKTIPFELSTIYIEEDTSTFHMKSINGIDVYISQKDNPTLIVPSLQTIITRFRIEGKFIAKIDFKFDKPIVVLKDDSKIQTSE